MDLDIPLYSAVFLNPELLVVAGGGGKGKHGLANKVALLDASQGSLELVQEYSFAPGSDCPMSMAIHDKRVVIGVNGDSQNTHMQLFSEKLEPVSSHSLFEVAGAYQRVVTATKTHIASVGAANSGHSPLVVLDTEMEVIWENDLKTDLRDLSFNNGLYLAALEPAAVHFYEVESGKEAHTLKAPAGAKFSRGQFVSKTKFVAAVQYPAKKRVELHVYEIEDEPMLATSTRVSLPSVSALASNGDIIALGSASGEVQVFNTRLAVLQRAKAVHKLPVSALAVSSEGAVASTSVAGTIHIFTTPFGERSLFAGFAVAGWAFLSVAVLAALVALVYSRIQNLAILAGSLSGGSGSSGAAADSFASSASENFMTIQPVPNVDDSVVSIQTVPNSEGETLLPKGDEGEEQDVTVTVTEIVTEVEDHVETVTVVQEGGNEAVVPEIVEAVTVYEEADPTNEDGDEPSQAGAVDPTQEAEPAEPVETHSEL